VTISYVVLYYVFLCRTEKILGTKPLTFILWTGYTGNISIVHFRY